MVDLSLDVGSLRRKGQDRRATCTLDRPTGIDSSDGDHRQRVHESWYADTRDIDVLMAIQ